MCVKCGGSMNLPKAARGFAMLTNKLIKNKPVGTECPPGYLKGPDGKCVESKKLNPPSPPVPGPPKLKSGGSVSKLAKVGVMNENLGPSGQYGIAKKGGSVKKAKLAAVAPPKNKITRADVLTRILKKKKK